MDTFSRSKVQRLYNLYLSEYPTVKWGNSSILKVEEKFYIKFFNEGIKRKCRLPGITEEQVYAFFNKLKESCPEYSIAIVSPIVRKVVYIEYE